MSPTAVVFGWPDHSLRLGRDNQPTSVHATLYACTVPDASCQLAADLGTIDVNAPTLPVMPDGRGVST